MSHRLTRAVIALFAFVALAAVACGHDGTTTAGGQSTASTATPTRTAPWRSAPSPTKTRPSWSRSTPRWPVT